MCLQPDDLASIRSILPKPEELVQVRECAKKTAAKATATLSPRTDSVTGTPGPHGHACSAAASGTASTPQTPRLGVVEAAFMALGSVDLLQAKMRALEFRSDIVLCTVVVSFADAQHIHMTCVRGA